MHELVRVVDLIKAPVKQRRAYIKAIATKQNIRTFIESGTYEGAMVSLMHDISDDVHSIELGDELYKSACEKFKTNQKVKLYHGDSAIIFPQIVEKITTRSIIFLDAHYSQCETARGDTDTPILREIEGLQNAPRKDHLIFIDDILNFVNGVEGYPSVDVLVKILSDINPLWRYKIEGGMLHVA